MMPAANFRSDSVKLRTNISRKLIKGEDISQIRGFPPFEALAATARHLLRRVSGVFCMANKRLDPGFLEGKHSNFFKDVLSGVADSNDFPNFRVSTIRGMPALWFSEEEFLHLAKPFEFALVGKFPLKQPDLDSIRKFFFNLKLSWEFSVTVLDPANVLIKLSNDLDYGRIFAHRSYFVFGCFMKIIKWSPHLDLSDESPVVPVWVSFPGLRPHLFSPRILLGLGSIFGRPIQTDNATAVGSRPSIARILVELDISKSYPDSVWLGPERFGYVQKVLFEGMPNFCMHCKSVGHKISECSKLFPQSRPAVNLSPSLADPVPNPPVSAVIPISSDSTPLCELDLVIKDAPLVLGGRDGVTVANNVDDDNVVVLGAPPSFISEVDAIPEGVTETGVVNDNGASPVSLTNPTENNVVKDRPTVISGLEHVSGPSTILGEADLAAVGLPASESPVVNGNCNMVCGRIETLNGLSVASENFINVPVNVVDTINLVNQLGAKSGFDVRNHVDWLNVSSESEFSDCGASPEFFGGSDPSNEFNMVRDRPVFSVATRGRLRGRGRRRR
ncbi:hypothetical protein KFK09_005526 [Dendrobium nobile]|uniref:DUF4283 domain-containing protein n=1 Tax=Dendrobium nobile TaxID=94219 RepID=A0A8T3C1K0_DENNO|nr:hypothetical protein KFK09_005526 [Dendrobium nobile]